MFVSWSAYFNSQCSQYGQDSQERFTHNTVQDTFCGCPERGEHSIGFSDCVRILQFVELAHEYTPH